MEKFRSKDTAAGLAVPHYQLIRIHGRGGPPTCATSFAKATEVRKASAVAEAMADKSAGTPGRQFCLARRAGAPYPRSEVGTSVCVDHGVVSALEFERIRDSTFLVPWICPDEKACPT
jgi:hypothetical protein